MPQYLSRRQFPLQAVNQRRSVAEVAHTSLQLVRRRLTVGFACTGLRVRPSMQAAYQQLLFHHLHNIQITVHASAVRRFTELAHGVTQNKPDYLLLFSKFYNKTRTHDNVRVAPKT